MNALVRYPSAAAAERMRRHRQRRRDGLRCLVIELRETEIDVLLHTSKQRMTEKKGCKRSARGYHF
jgi:hypothetical protein